MSELDDFLRWGVNVENDRDARDSFGHPMSEHRFPYGTLSWWIHEYKLAKGQK